MYECRLVKKKEYWTIQKLKRFGPFEYRTSLLFNADPLFINIPTAPDDNTVGIRNPDMSGFQMVLIRPVVERSSFQMASKNWEKSLDFGRWNIKKPDFKMVRILNGIQKKLFFFGSRMVGLFSEKKQLELKWFFIFYLQANHKGTAHYTPKDNSQKTLCSFCPSAYTSTTSCYR